MPLKNDLLLIKISNMNSRLLSLALITFVMLFMANAVAQNNSNADLKEKTPDVIIKSTNDAPTEANPYGTPLQSSEVTITKDGTTTSIQTEIKDESTPYYTVNEMPTYIDGKGELPFHISKNARYPKEARIDKAEGIVIVQIIVEKDGSFSNAQVVQSIHPKLDEEALRVVGTLNNFIPGKQKGEAVRCYYQIPVPFVLKK